MSKTIISNRLRSCMERLVSSLAESFFTVPKFRLIRTRSAEGQQDAAAMADGLKSQLGSDFEERRAKLVAGGGSKAKIFTTEKLSRAQLRAEAMQSNVSNVFKGVQTPDEALKVIKSNPKFVQQINKSVFDTIEDLLTGVPMSPVSGGHQSVAQLALSDRLSRLFGWFTPLTLVPLVPSHHCR